MAKKRSITINVDVTVPETVRDDDLENAFLGRAISMLLGNGFDRPPVEHDEIFVTVTLPTQERG